MPMTAFQSPDSATWPNAPGHHLLVGAPQSGKTTALASAFIDHVRRHGPSRAVFLTPTRQQAAHLQNIIAHGFGGTTGELLVRTPASLAFGVLRHNAVLAGKPAPTLITGPEQDYVLAELIAGHIEDGAGPDWPDEITPHVLSMRTFRDELRDLLMRAAEAGLDGQALRETGERHQRPEWVAAGHILDEYIAVTLLGEITPDRGARYDSATILNRAVAALDHPDGLNFEAVVHDDYQDATLATSRLLGKLADNGAQLLLASNPDTGVQGFRGGLPALARTAALPTGSQQGAFGARVHVLPHTFMAPGVWQKISAVAEDLPPLIGADRRRVVPVQGPSPVPVPVETTTVASGSAESAYLARRLRELHVLEGKPWSDMAIIVRGHHHVQRLRRSLASAGIPVRVSGAHVPLREEPAVTALLTCLDVVTSPQGANARDVSELLMSAFGGIDALALRRIRRALRHHNPEVPSADLLRDAMEAEHLRQAAGNHPGLHRIARMFQAGRNAVGEGRDVDMVLWAMWDAAGLARTWQDLALTPGPRSARVDADLDAVVALFTVAEQFVNRRAGANPRTFIDHLQQQDFPADTLAARSDRTEAVSLHTPTSALGQHWPCVIVAGVQEDTWPDLRLRDTLLGSAALAELATAEHVEGHTEQAGARAHVLADERRMFLAACSRATTHLIVTAVNDGETRPSMFFDRLSSGANEPVTVPAPLDLRGLVGTLRHELHHPSNKEDSQRAEAAKALLAELAEAQVGEAKMENVDPPWSGMGVLKDDASKPVLNPSTIEQVLTCPLQWFLTTHGGRAATTRAQSLGTLIHDIAKNNPHGTFEELNSELDARWHELDLPDNHIGQAARTKADHLITTLASYLASHDSPAEVEVSFAVDTGPAIIKGQVDRVEHRSTGPHIVDFKTGSIRPKRDIAKENPQLGAYQLAASQGAFDEPTQDDSSSRPQGHSGGASLVFLAINKTPLVHEQAPLQEEETDWATHMVERAAKIITSQEFPAVVSPACTYCPVRASCPAVMDGQRLGAQEPAGGEPA